MLAKLMIGEDEANDSLPEMLDLSVEKTLRLSREEYRALEAATTCKGAKTSSVKKALLLRALEKEFDVTFPRYSTGSIKSIEQLCLLVGELQGTGALPDQFEETTYILR